VSQLQTPSQMKPILAVAGLVTAVAAVAVVTGRHTLSWVCHPCLLPCLKVGLLLSRQDSSVGAVWCCSYNVNCIITCSACHALCNQPMCFVAFDAHGYGA